MKAAARRLVSLISYYLHTLLLSVLCFQYTVYTFHCQFPSQILQSGFDSSVAAHCLTNGKREIVPAHPAISDDEGYEKEDGDAADPRFIPLNHNLDTSGPTDIGFSAKRRCMHPAVEMLKDQDDNDDDNAEDEQPAPQTRRPTTIRKQAARPTSWNKVDLDKPAIPTSRHLTLVSF